MVTVLKNVTNILTAIGELYLFRKRQNPKVWTAMFLMVNGIVILFIFIDLLLFSDKFEFHCWLGPCVGKDLTSLHVNLGWLQHPVI